MIKLKRNLKENWSPVFCFGDGSEAVRRLEQMGAHGVTAEELRDFSELQAPNLSLF